MAGSILLLGEYNVGKTHFGGQLLGRLSAKGGALRMARAPASLAPFDGVLATLHDGRAAAHTPSAQYVESRWTVVDGAGRELELVWPDYGGEQVRSIGADRSMPAEWRSRVLSTDAWVLMARIHHTHVSDDIFSRPLASIAREVTPAGDFAMSDQARLVDFLQWLMFVRGAGVLSPNTRPRLLMLLSCWDELPVSERNERPLEVMRRRLPMVAAFVEANWAAGSLDVLGMSALERALSEDVQDEEFVNRGPESFGYVVLPDGSSSRDLTLAVAPLLG